MAKFKKLAIQSMAMLGAACIFGGVAAQSLKSDAGAEVPAAAKSAIQKVNASLKTNQEDFYDNSVIYKLPESVSTMEEISVIVTMSADSVMDAYEKSAKTKTLSEFVSSKEGRQAASKVERERNKLVKTLRGSGVEYELGEKYDTVVSGFEITIKAGDFETVAKAFGSNADLIVGNTYLPAETKVVTNDVDVYETGIFDSSKSVYQGDGVVVAVLDTGLDYTHTAFSDANFNPKEPDAFTLENVSEKVKDTMAASFTAGLTGKDVYVGRKVPYAYDYADKDPDVVPINSEHGTHVAGVIAGEDDTIVGVAPNAQLAIMKVFSDMQEGAKDSWILSALEDCVSLGVDVINMSLGTSCGFTREVDEVKTNEIYDKIRAAGISLICAASNDYNSTFSSTKNGSNPLTSNPDSGTVGAPSTYSAALSVASVDGVKTPYLLYGEDIIYFTEASTSDAEVKKKFVDDILSTLGDNVQSHEFEYVTIPGIGRSSDYPHEDGYYDGKIVLVKRGTTTFEDKVRVALKEKGAAGIIIYNNISGTISMSVGANVGAVCSISQDEGEKLAAAGEGKIRIDRSQVAGPFMSDFSSWGPTSDLKIKPEITAHGGEILSAVPGQQYDRLSGTSMAAPNQAGAAALIRQYVKYSGTFGADLEPIQVTDLVNQLMMSTADIIYNKNGLPYAVRKQGSGLVNITKAYTSASYITTYDKEGNLMDKTKFELGDDKEKTGVYEMTFDINNVSGSSVTYGVSSIVMTEGVSPTYTSHGDTTSTQDGRLLEGATEVTSVTGGQQSGNAVTVGAKQSAKVTVKVTLSDKDKEYLDASFKYGMYVEGFITLDAKSGTEVDMNVPMLAFYGDWTEAPIFDEEYYDTHKDEIDAGIDAEDKLMADAYATRVIGGLYSDYIATLGEYYFQQDPAATQIAASKDHIALSNQLNEGSGSVTLNSIYSIWAGLLRNVKELNISIVEDATGKEIFEKTIYNQMKSRSSGGTIYQSSIDVDFSAIEYRLKNNTRYTVTVESYIDYGEKEDQKNARNVFEFPLYIDFEAPIVTDVTYRTETDRTTKKTKLFADLQVYDNHYAMGVQLGQVTPADPGSGYTFEMGTFGKYVTPVYSSFNATSTVTIELTDYVAQIKNSAGFDKETGKDVVYNNNSFIAICYDYAMNSAVYEIELPDDILSMYFDVEDNTLKLSPNETKELSDILKIYPGESWLATLDFETSDKSVVDIVNQTLLAKKSGTATVTAIGRNQKGEAVRASVNVKVLAEGEEGYVGGYTIPEVNRFEVTGYKTNKAYYSVTSSEREIGVTGSTYDFGNANVLSMFPSESVTLKHTMDSYFPERTGITYSVGNSKIATVSDDGTIVAQAEGSTIVTVRVTFDGGTTIYSDRVSIIVKDPYTINAIFLMSYKGLGGEVVVPDDRGITTIYSYAFSNYEYVEKDLAAGDVIDDEDPYNIKQMYIGEDTITKIVLPEGVTDIQSYAFAKLTALEEIVIPHTLEKIGVGAFLGCKKLKKITYVDENGIKHENNLGNVKFINQEAFKNTALEAVVMDEIVAIGNYGFENTKLNYVELSSNAQSLGIGAFKNNKYLVSATFDAPKMKLGSEVFNGCTQLFSININASVIPSYAFNGCSSLEEVTLGKDVSIIGEFAFAGTNVAGFEVSVGNTVLTAEENGALLYNGTELVLVSPIYGGKDVGGKANTVELTKAASIAAGAFAGNNKIYNVIANNVTKLGAYAFAGCKNLDEVTMNEIVEISDYAFMDTGITETPNLSNIKKIGGYAFANTRISAVTIADGATLMPYAFAYCTELKTVTIGKGATIGEMAFYCPVELATYESTGNMQSFDYYNVRSYEVKDKNGTVVNTYSYYYYDFTVGAYSSLKQVTIGANSVIGNYAFSGCAKLETLILEKDEATGISSTIGDYAFYNAASLKNVDLSGVTEIGAYAFSGSQAMVYCLENNQWQYAYEREYLDGEEVITNYVYSYFAPIFETIDLSKVTKLGEGAFAYNNNLKTVTLGEGLTEIPEGAFTNSVIEEIELPETVSAVGDYAFYGAKFTEIDLTGVSKIGAYAFAETLLEEVTLKDNAVIGDGAFAYCYGLSEVTGLDKATYIGAQAFYGAALEALTLTNAEYIGSFAFGASSVKSVAFGDKKLVELGENPFYGCEIETFGREEVVSKFGNDITIKELVETYDVSAAVKVIDGVLYQIVPNGLELISYPAAKKADAYTVEEGTVKISARAFAGAALKNVTLSTELKAIGDKAFYGCENLSIVVFRSYDAPMLEEEYDENYLSYENLPFTGKMQLTEDMFVEGLGISKYYMWNMTSSFNNFYFGANFVNYIGHIENKLVMVKPANGQGYDTFIFSQYFDTAVDGDSAANEATLNVIAMINALPSKIQLTDEDAVVAARAAYEAITSLEQKSLVEKANYSKLTEAEATIKYLKQREQNNSSSDSSSSTPEDSSSSEAEGGGCFGGMYTSAAIVMTIVAMMAICVFVKKEEKLN